MKFFYYILFLVFSLITTRATGQTITGPGGLCNGSTATLVGSPAGGVWSSSNAAICTVGPSGDVTGLTAGTATISYATMSGTATQVMTVNPAPSGISGSSFICPASITTMSNAVIGGTWTSANSSVAIIGSSTGIINGISAGTTNVSYVLPSGCRAVKTVTVDMVVPAISGSNAVCTGTSTSLSNIATGGTWTSSTAPVCSVNFTTGFATGMSPGTATINYTLASGCFAQTVVTVNAIPPAITGSASMCNGNTSTYTNTSPGGAWSSSNPLIVSINPTSGVATASMLGATTIFYTVGGSTGCSVTQPVTVTVGPSPIVGPTALCNGVTTTLSSASSGGSWSSSAPGVLSVGGVSGIAATLSAGTAIITYSIGTCYDTMPIVVNVSPSPIAGPTNICNGATSTLTNSVSGGAWSSSAVPVALIGGSGVVTALSPGTSTISYALSSGCTATALVTVGAAPGPITGPSSVCAGSYIVLSDAVLGGTWTGSDPTIASVTTLAYPGTIVGVMGGTITVTYTLYTGCYDTFTVTIIPQPLVSVTATPASCGPIYVGIAGGADTYTWAPATGLSCTTCLSALIDINSTTVYTVTGTDINGCTNTAVMTVNGNRISGHISFNAATPSSTTMRVWLRQFNSSDSTIVDIDSTMACLDGVLPYYEFAGHPAGNYFLDAKLLSSMPGGSGYVPTFSTSTPYWNTATVLSHTTVTDTQHIQMRYGSLVAGAGTIRGFVRTNTQPARDMLMLLRDGVTGEVLSYAYTDTVGAYAFNSIAYGMYTIYPEEYRYYTTPSQVYTLSASNNTDTATFKKDTIARRIYPFNFSTAVPQVMAEGALMLFPNPATDVLQIRWTQAIGVANVAITDMVGRAVQQQTIDMGASAGLAAIDIRQLQTGIYYVVVKTNELTYNCKLMIQH
jgi:uncharacterized protein YjdB